MKLTTSLLVAAAASLAGATAQRERGADFLSLLQREFARSSEILEQMWDATIGRVEEGMVEENTNTNSVRVVVVEVESNDQESLTADEKSLACRVAVKRVAEQATLREATAQLATRLRTPLNDVVSVHYMDETKCDALDRPLLVQECMRVSEMAKEIEVFLRHGKTDIEICDAVRVADEQEQAQGPTPLSCKLCKRFVQMVDQAIAQDVAQVQVVRDILGDICDSMAADSMCHTFIKRFDDVVGWLNHGTDPDVVCTRLTMCTATQEEVLNAAALSTVTDDSHGCFYCAQISSVVGFVTKHAPDQLDTLRTVLKYVCKVTPEDCKCDEAEKNFDKIVELTKQGKAPKEVCEAIGMCKGTERSDESKLVALVSTSNAARKITTALLSFSTPYGGVRDEKKCFYCDYFTTLLEIAIQEDEKDMDDVRQYADMICGMLGDANMCHQYVDKLDFVVDSLKQGKKPREICTALKFCAAKRPAIAANAEPLAVSRRAVGAIDNCFFCTQLASIFKVALAQDESQIDQIRMVADLICKALPAENMCLLVMKQVDQVIDALKNGEEPEAICHDLKFCPKESPLGLVAFGDNKCVYCEYATLVLEFAVKQDEQDFDAIRMYADIICGMLGESNQCHQYVEKLDFILDSLKKGKGPHEICKALKFCAAKSMAIAPPEESLAVVTPVLSKAVSIDNCFFCTQLAALFKVALAQDEGQISQIRTIADLVCKALPKENKCHLVMKEVDQMIDSLKRGEEPAAICHDLNFCPKMKALDIPFALPAKSVHDHDCAYCEGAATVLEFAIKAKPDEVQQVREAAGIVCDFMPADDKCHDDLKMFDKAVADLKAGKSPHDICKDLNICKTIKSVTQLSPKAAAKLDMLDAKAISSKAEAKSMSVGCLLCEYTAEVVSHILDNQSELRLAKKTLGTMCFVLPPMARCDAITAKFDDLVKLVGEDKKSPSEACHAINMCDAAFVEPRTTISDVVAEERP